MFRKSASLFSGFLKPEGPPTNAAFKERNEKGASPTKETPSPIQQKLIPREAQLAGPNRTANSLPEVHGTFCLLKLPVSPIKLPFHPTFEILHLPAGNLPIGCAQKTDPFDAPFAADGDMATVTWSNLPERLKRMGCGVNFKADA